jgi:NADP-dependent aldehyde dehydrogenase
VSTNDSTGSSASRQQLSVPEATGMAGAAAPALAASAPAERAAWLRAVADALDARVDDLAAVADEETALGLPRLTGEVGRTTGQLRLFAGVLEEGSCFEAVIDHADPDATPPKPDLRRMLQPIGPVAVFAASNFPFAFSVVGGDTASALAAGCPVIVKAHPGHPRTSDLTAEIVGAALTRAGAPAGTFALIHGLEAGRELVTDPTTRAVGFTGSLGGGRALFDLAVGRPDPIPFYGELGSLNPVIVTEGAASTRPDEIATGLLGSMTMGVGQFCTKPGVVFVPDDDGLFAAIGDAAADAGGGTMLGDRIADGFGQGLRALADHADVEVVAGDPATAISGRAAEPVVLLTGAARLSTNADALLAECFGPTTLLVRYRSRGELFAGLRALPGGLTATVHAEDAEVDATSELLPLLTGIAGRVLFGGWPTGVAVSWAQHHGGPWPATTAPLHTSVGATAIRRFLRPISYQNAPIAWLPPQLHDDNPLGIPQRVDGHLRLPAVAVDGDAGT